MHACFMPSRKGKFFLTVLKSNSTQLDKKIIYVSIWKSSTATKDNLWDDNRWRDGELSESVVEGESALIVVCGAHFCYRRQGTSTGLSKHPTCLRERLRVQGMKKLWGGSIILGGKCDRPWQGLFCDLFCTICKIAIF
jgi:hypothetical protein